MRPRRGGRESREDQLWSIKRANSGEQPRALMYRKKEMKKVPVGMRANEGGKILLKRANCVEPESNMQKGEMKRKGGIARESMLGALCSLGRLLARGGRVKKTKGPPHKGPPREIGMGGFCTKAIAPEPRRKKWYSSNRRKGKTEGKEETESPNTDGGGNGSGQEKKTKPHKNQEHRREMNSKPVHPRRTEAGSASGLKMTLNYSDGDPRLERPKKEAETITRHEGGPVISRKDRLRTGGKGS